MTHSNKVTAKQTHASEVFLTFSPSQGFMPMEVPAGLDRVTKLAPNNEAARFVVELYKLHGIEGVRTAGQGITLKLADGYNWKMLADEVTKLIGEHIFSSMFNTSFIDYTPRPKMDEEEIGPNDPWPIDEPEFSPEKAKPKMDEEEEDSEEAERIRRKPTGLLV